MRPSAWAAPLKILVVALCLAPVATAGVRAGGPNPPARAAKHKMTMVGNMHPYPDLERAGPGNVLRAQRLKRASRRTAHRFNTLAKARALGYETRRMRRPGFVHARKFATIFWGTVFDPDAPQALVFWCPAHGRCTLTTYMYRAPAGDPPPTWGKLLQWHRHGGMSTTWMTHVWLVRHTRPAFATCAPWTALKEAYRLMPPSDYREHMTDEPCPDGDSMDMPDH